MLRITCAFCLDSDHGETYDDECETFEPPIAIEVNFT